MMEFRLERPDFDRTDLFLPKTPETNEIGGFVERFKYKAKNSEIENLRAAAEAPSPLAMDDEFFAFMKLVFPKDTSYTNITNPILIAGNDAYFEPPKEDGNEKE